MPALANNQSVVPDCLTPDSLLPSNQCPAIAPHNLAVVDSYCHIGDQFVINWSPSGPQLLAECFWWSYPVDPLEPTNPLVPKLSLDSPQLVPKWIPGQVLAIQAPVGAYNICFAHDLQSHTNTTFLSTLTNHPVRRASAMRALGLLLADGAPTVRWGKTFWRVGRVFFTKTNVTWKRKVEKSFRRLEMNRPSEGFKQVVDKIWGRMAKIGPKTEMSGPEKHSL